MAVALGDFGGAVGFGGERAGLELAGPCAEAHGSAHLFDTGQFAQLVDDAVRRGGVELAGVGAGEAADVARVLDAGGLHAEADAEVGDVVLAGVADGVEHALDAALAEAAGDKDAVEAAELGLVVAIGAAGCIAVGLVVSFQALGLDPGDAQLEVVSERAVD